MKKHSLLIFSVLLLLYATGCSIGSIREDTPSGYLRQTEPDSTPVIFAPGIVSVHGRFDVGFTMSPDGKSMAFGVMHETDSSETNIRFIHWKNGDWSGPDLSPITNNVNTSFPMFGPKGDKLYFTKTDTTGDNDLWIAEYKQMSVFGVQPIGLPVNSTEREAGHGVSLQGNLYFTSNRDDKHQCCGDIYRVTTTQPDIAEKVTSLNSEADEEGLFLSANEDYIIIQAWKNEYQSKHDLFISYRTDEGRWTSPLRLNDKINSTEIEQRPFVTADHRFLFFSRMSIEEQQGKTLYESDIFWVNTSEIFKPFLNRSINTFPVTSGADFSIQLAKDIFKDINDQDLDYTVTLADDSPLPANIHFNPEAMTINGNMNDISSLTLNIKAADDDRNESTTYLEIIVQR